MLLSMVLGALVAEPACDPGKDLTLVGFSMGGGEIARYLGKYGSTDVSRAVIISDVLSFRGFFHADHGGGG